MAYNSYITLPWELERDAPPFESNEIKFPESFVRHILNEYSKIGDVVFDPFAGMGTTLFIAEEMRRRPFGMELDSEKHQWVAGQLENWTHHINDDAANIGKYNIPKIDLLLTSPPYMPIHHKHNPLYNGDPKKAGYDNYLKRLGAIFKKISPYLKAKAKIIIQADNLKDIRHFTPLISDISQTLSKDFKIIDQVTVLWDNPKKDYPFTNYLVFKKR